jgi:hypothetical protein
MACRFAARRCADGVPLRGAQMCRSCLDRNRSMPTYLVRQAEAVRSFFADGGPPELARPAAG